MTAGALVVHGARTRRQVVATVGMVAIAVAAYRVSWNELILYVGHTNFHSVTELEEERQRRLSADRFKGPQDVFAITWKDGKPYFFINGYISIPLASKSEKLLGVLAPMLSPRLDDALVLGVGTGATAGTVGLIFDRADVVEINRAVLGNLHRMEEYNFGIEHQPGVNIIHDDGIHFVKTSPKKYSLILNTVTTPLYFSSSKLYTVDFFEAVMERLRPDGVYVTWMDQRIGDRGAEIILETLAHVFRECWLNYMNYNYFILACSDADIGLAQFDAVVGHRKLSRYFSQRHSLPLRLLPYGVISLDALEFRSPEGAPLNTLDFPVLEHEMARLQTGASLRKFKDRLKQQMDLEELQAALAPWMEWKPAEFLLHSDLRIKTTSTLARTLRYKTRQQFGDLDTAYDEAALALAAEVGTPRAYYNYGKRLQGRNRDDAAITALLRVVELDPSFNNAHYYLGRTYYSQGAYEKALTHFVSEWKRDRDRDVPMWVGRTLVKLSRYEEALEWVKRARASGVRIDDATMDYYRRLARQGRTNGLHGTSVKNGQRKGGGS
jgi:spermidine synthase